MSPLLSPAERTYWAAEVPVMTAEQTEKLDSLLLKAEQISWTEGMRHYVDVAAKTTASFAS